MNDRIVKILARTIGVCLLIGFFSYSFWDFNRQLNTSMRDQAKEYLIESSIQSAEALNYKISEYKATTKAIAHAISLQKIDQVSDIVATLEEAVRLLSFNRLSYTELNGQSHSSDGLQADIRDRWYFQRAKDGEVVVSDVLTSLFDGHKVFTIAVPLIQENEVKAVLHSTYETEELHDIVQAHRFGGQSFSYLVSYDGSFICKDEMAMKFPEENSIFSVLEKAGVTHEQLAELRNNMRALSGGFLQFQIDGQGYYMVYENLGINDWFIFNYVPMQVIAEQTDALFMQGLTLAARVSIMVLVVMLYSFYAMWRSHKDIAYHRNQLEFINSNIQGGLYKCGVLGSGYFDYMSEGFLKLVGYTREEIEENGRNVFLNLVYEEDREQLQKLRKEAFEKHSDLPLTSEYRIKQKDGSLIWVLDKGQFMVDADGIPWYFSIILDHTKQMQILDELHYNEQRYRIIAEQSSSVIFDFDYRSSLIQMAPMFSAMFGYEVVEEEYPLHEIERGHIHPEDQDALQDLFLPPLPHSPIKNAEVRIQAKDHGYIWCRFTITTIFDEQQRPSKAIGRILNIDREKKEIAQLLRKANMDELTGLYNKATTQNLITAILEQSTGNELHAFLFIDIDDFKQVNDSKGHLFGDFVLADIGQILKGLTRSNDIVGRLGGDEFAIFLKDIPNKEVAVAKARDVCSHLELYRLMNHDGNLISCSIGVAIAPHDAATFEELFQKADTAVYHVKNSGKNTYALYMEQPV